MSGPLEDPPQRKRWSGGLRAEPALQARRERREKAEAQQRQRREQLVLRIGAEMVPVFYRAAVGVLAGIAGMVTPDRSVGGRRLARGVLLSVAWM
jgi:hypothetical protein